MIEKSLPVDVIAQAIRVTKAEGAGAIAEDIMKALRDAGWSVVPSRFTESRNQ